MRPAHHHIAEVRVHKPLLERLGQRVGHSVGVVDQCNVALPESTQYTASCGSCSVMQTCMSEYRMARAATAGVRSPLTAVENATTFNRPRGTPPAIDRAAPAHRSKAWNTSGALSTITCPAGVSTTLRPAGATNATPICRSSRLICCDTAEAVNPNCSAACPTVPNSATARNARSPPTSIMNADYTITGNNFCWTFTFVVRRIHAMSDLRQPAEELFGTNLVAMATPMRPGGDLSVSDVGSLVDHLLAKGCDGIVVAGTTGESPTLTEAETTALVQVVKGRAGNRAKVIVGSVPTTPQPPYAAPRMPKARAPMPCFWYARTTHYPLRRE